MPRTPVAWPLRQRDLAPGALPGFASMHPKPGL
jgi:hypothetical protein